MLKDEEIIKKELDEKELKEINGAYSDVLGGSWSDGTYAEELAKCSAPFAWEKDINDCIRQWKRNIYKTKFPHCAATVEDGSWCGTNDACFSDAVNYQNMSDCSKAWK